jgi:glycosyltransferase involved in cell wall biosynthesis
MKNKFNIGAALIVKNEEKNIERALKSLLALCSQIVVVDTGSIDATPSICSRLGAELHFRKWTNDFSEARNYALSLMRTDWIISLDADEELIRSSFHSSEHLFENEKIGGIRVKILNELSKGGIREHAFTRIFRNNPGIRFNGKIHEQISDSILDMNLEIADTDIIIQHYGYHTIEPERIERNRELLKTELAEQGEDPWLKYHFAETLFSGTNPSEALPIYQELSNSFYLSSDQRDTARLRVGQIALGMNNINLSLELHNYTFGNTDLEGLRILVLISALLMTGDKQKAKHLWTYPALHQSRMVDKNLLETISKVI